jgi:uncharacterized repeat protein (TIGR03803 family)
MVCIVLVFCAATAIASPAQTLTTLYNFCSQPNCADGAAVDFAALAQATDGNFYGTTYAGGANDGGTVFKITPAGTFTTLYSFCSQTNCTDGYRPKAGLVQATDGNFYGTTSHGGVKCSDRSGCGTVFKITPSGTLTTLHSFTGSVDGVHPSAELVQATDGNLYGTTEGEPGTSDGTVFKITPSGTLTTVYSFCSQKDCADGRSPDAKLVQASDGNFYGTTSLGGANIAGTVFKITPSGTLTTLYSFCSRANCADGYWPLAALVQATDGNLYGTTSEGGANLAGTVFKITLTGAFTTLHSFGIADGRSPLAELVQASDGNLYGTTCEGGANLAGTVFKITPSGTLTTLYSFNVADGNGPCGGLVQGKDGKLYGTTLIGGANDKGTVFSQSVNLESNPLHFVPVAPCRLADTRTIYGGSGPIPGGTSRSFYLPQAAK